MANEDGCFGDGCTGDWDVTALAERNVIESSDLTGFPLTIAPTKRFNNLG